MQHALYVRAFADVNEFGFYINQTPIKKDFCEHNPYDCRLGAQFETLNMEITYLKEIYHSVYSIYM